MSNYKRVALLRGGPGDEYSVSMKTGAAVLQSLRKQGYFTKDIIITKNGDWLEEGKIRSVDQVLESIDVVFIGMHGAYAEDGEVQKTLQRKHLPFTGSRSLPSAIAFNKSLAKDTLKAHGVLTPSHRLIKSDQVDDLSAIIKEIEASFGPEYILKPLANGSSIGIRLVHEGQSLEEIARETLSLFETVLVEEFIRGKEGTGAVLENFRNERLYTFPSLEILPPKNSPFFTNEAKYSGQTEFVCPARFSYQERQKIADVSALVHDVLGLDQYSRSDFMVKDGEVYFLEVNTLPGLTPESLYPKAVNAVGMTFDQLTEHLIETAGV